MSRAPGPDADDEAVCGGCGRRVKGKGARRWFARHKGCARRDERSVGGVGMELRYGEGVRLIGPPMPEVTP